MKSFFYCWDLRLSRTWRVYCQNDIRLLFVSTKLLKVIIIFFLCVLFTRQNCSIYFAYLLNKLYLFNIHIFHNKFLFFFSYFLFAEISIHRLRSWTHRYWQTQHCFIQSNLCRHHDVVHLANWNILSIRYRYVLPYICIKVEHRNMVYCAVFLCGCISEYLRTARNIMDYI